jgi:hypothetical protein
MLFEEMQPDVSDFRFTEAVVEEAALSWLAELGYGMMSGPDIAPGQPGSEREPAIG